MLVDHPMTLTIPVSDLERARSWYEDKLGLAPVQEVPGEALAYRTGAGQSLLLFFSDEAGAVEHQLAAWRVDDLAAEVTELRQRGVRFEEYDRPDLRTVDGHSGNSGRARRMVHGQRGQRVHHHSAQLSVARYADSDEVPLRQGSCQLSPPSRCRDSRPSSDP